eukprot:scaffold42659_cov62-Phaeocystis_antarctica.AAC.2
MPCSPTRGRAHSQNDAEHLRSLTPCPVYSSLILYNTTHALRGRAWCALTTRRFVRLACHVSTSVPINIGSRMIVSECGSSACSVSLSEGSRYGSSAALRGRRESQRPLNPAKRSSGALEILDGL